MRKDILRKILRETEEQQGQPQHIISRGAKLVRWLSADNGLEYDGPSFAVGWASLNLLNKIFVMRKEALHDYLSYDEGDPTSDEPIIIDKRQGYTYLVNMEVFKTELDTRPQIEERDNRWGSSHIYKIDQKPVRLDDLLKGEPDAARALVEMYRQDRLYPVHCFRLGLRDDLPVEFCNQQDIDLISAYRLYKAGKVDGKIMDKLVDDDIYFQNGEVYLRVSDYTAEALTLHFGENSDTAESVLSGDLDFSWDSGYTPPIDDLLDMLDKDSWKELRESMAKQGVTIDAEEDDDDYDEDDEDEEKGYAAAEDSAGIALTLEVLTGMSEREIETILEDHEDEFEDVIRALKWAYDNADRNSYEGHYHNHVISEIKERFGEPEWRDSAYFFRIDNFLEVITPKIDDLDENDDYYIENTWGIFQNETYSQMLYQYEDEKDLTLPDDRYSHHDFDEEIYNEYVREELP